METAILQRLMDEATADTKSSDDITFYIETPEAKRPIMFVSLYYTKGSTYTGRRGYYLSLTPGEREGVFNRYHISEGVRTLVSPAPVTRKSPKARREALAAVDADLITRMLNY